LGSRCVGCKGRKKGCSIVIKAKPSAASVHSASPPLDEEIVVEESPKKNKGKGIFGALTGFKRPSADISPPADPPTSKARRFKMVGVEVPPAPFPHSHYHQLGSRPSATSPTSSIVAEHPPALSSSPSLASFDSTGSTSGLAFEVDRLTILLSASQEDLSIQRSQYEEQARRQQERFERERLLMQSRIRELEGNTKNEGGSSVKDLWGAGGSGSRRG
jgi:hypothetical protein